MSYLTDRKDAEELAALLSRFDELCSELAEFSSRMPDDQGAIIRSVFGDAAARSFIEIVQPMVQAFPELDPDAQAPDGPAPDA